MKTLKIISWVLFTLGLLSSVIGLLLIEFMPKTNSQWGNIGFVVFGFYSTLFISGLNFFVCLSSLIFFHSGWLVFFFNLIMGFVVCGLLFGFL